VLEAFPSFESASGIAGMIEAGAFTEISMEQANDQ